MSFHLGKPILAMVFIAVFSGVAVLLHRSPPRQDLVLWTFTDIHRKTYESIADQFERQTARTLDIQLLSTRAENVRLESMFMSNQTGPILPDVVEIEIGQVGRFFRPPVDQIGLLPLNQYLRNGGWDKRLLPARLETWSKHGLIFGVPHDVHPVAIAYRKDLFDQAGVNLDEAQTWQQFQDLCLKFQSYWQAQGKLTRHAIELSRSSPDYLNAMLLQRGVNLVDQDDQIHIADPIVAQTVAFYAQLIAGPRAIAGESAGGPGIWTRDVDQGNLCAFMMPDWRVSDLRTFAPQLSGKLRVRPLPRFESCDPPTSTWGGTMIGITRNCKHPDEAWKLIQFLYLSPTGLQARQQTSDILPPVIDWWDRPGYHRADPYFGGQKIDELYIDLARQIPRRYVTPGTIIAQEALGVVLNRAVAYVQRYGSEHLERYCGQLLQLAADDLRGRVQHDRFE